MLTLGGLVSWAGWAAATHESTSEQHVVTFATTINDIDPLPHPITETVRETTTVVVTTTPPTTTEPPPGGCTVDDTSGCVPGTTVRNVMNQTLECNRALSSYGPLPILFVVDSNDNFPGIGFRFAAGCTGDSNPESIDLMFDVRGNGRTFGPQDDALRLTNAHPGASNIQATGVANCGRNEGSFHQDWMQVLGGTNVLLVDVVSGDYD